VGVLVPEDLLPTYQYACTACDHRFEAVQSFSDASLTECPQCGEKLRKVFSSVGIVFKGSGFYRTDSRGSSGVAAATSSESKSESTAKSESDTRSPKHGELVKVTDTSTIKSPTAAASTNPAA
jgi:putative FmdB family regulatory protein